MGNLCSNVRPRYKIYVIGVFDGKIDDLCSFAKSYPNQLPRIGRYLLKQLNIRVQQNKSNMVHKDIHLAMQAWNNLIYSCNSDIEQFESFILQSMILLFAEHSIKLHVLAMKTLRKYLPYRHKMSIDELLSFVDSCTSSADSQESSIRIDALKTLSIIFMHLENSPFCPDLYTKYERIIHAILLNLDINDTNNNKNIYAEHCYERFCSLISTNDLSIMLKALSLILTEHFSWSPTKFCVKLLDILTQKGSSIEPITIVQEILHILSSLSKYDEQDEDETFVEWIDRLTTMDSIIIILQQFSSRVISKNGTRKNRNPILSKLFSLLHIIDEKSVKIDSMDISTERILKFARNLLDCIQYYVIDISYIDAHSVLLRMIKYLSITQSFIHTQLQLKCILTTLAHRTGKIRSSQHTQHDILKSLLKFHVQQQYQNDNNNSDIIIELLHLSIQNLLLLSSVGSDNLHQIGFNQNQWAIKRVEQFLESQIKYKIILKNNNNDTKSYYFSPTQSPTPSPSSSITSSPSHSHNHIHHDLDIGLDGFTIYKLPSHQREWLYATIYSYLENTKQFTEITLLRITYTIIIIAISTHNFTSNESRKINSEIIDFELLLPFLMLIQKLGFRDHQEFINKNKNKNNDNKSCKESVICHSIILSVLLYIRHFIHSSYSKKTNYKLLFHRFCQIIDSVYNKCKQHNQIWSKFHLHTNGLLTVDTYSDDNDINPNQMTHIIPFDDIIDSLSLYFDLVHARRLSASTMTTIADSWKVNIKKAFPVTIILDNLCQESDLEVSLSAISASILLTPSRLQRRYRVHSTASFDDFNLKLEDGVISNQLKSVQSIKSLNELNTFQEIASTYSDNIDRLNILRLSTTYHHHHHNNNNNTNSHQYIESETYSNTKSFTFSTEMIATQQPNPSFFEYKPNVMQSRSNHRNSDLSQFYIEFENKENAAILHDGLCNRLDLSDLNIENENNLLNVEHELDEVNYDDINHSQQHIHNESESMQSPMRQLKAKGKSAVIHIRNRTRQLTQHMSVRNMRPNIPNMPNFKNTPHAIREKTKQGSKAIKEKLQNVKTKMLEQTRKKNKKDKVQEKEEEEEECLDADTVQIEMVGTKPPNQLSRVLSLPRQQIANKNKNKKYIKHTRYKTVGIHDGLDNINYHSADDDNDDSYTISTEQSPSPSSSKGSKGSINTI